MPTPLLPDKPSHSTPLSDELAAVRARKYKKRSYRSPEKIAHDQAYADWLEAPLPIDEKRGITNVSDLIIKIVSRINLAPPEIQAEQLRERWNKLAGDFIAQNSELVSIRNGVAIVKVLHPSLRFHLNQWKAPLLEKLRIEFDKHNISELKFIFG